MNLKTINMARRLTFRSNASEIFGLTAVVAMSVVFIASLGATTSVPAFMLIAQVALLTAIYAFIQYCARWQSISLLAEVKGELLEELAALRE